MSGGEANPGVDDREIVGEFAAAFSSRTASSYASLLPSAKAHVLSKDDYQQATDKLAMDAEEPLPQWKVYEVYINSARAPSAHYAPLSDADGKAQRTASRHARGCCECHPAAG